MSVVVFRKYLDVAKVQIKQSIIINTLLALVIVIATPIVFGIKNLDSVASSMALERFVALIGIVLFTPLFSPEGDKNVQEIVESKYTSPTLVYFSRLFLSTIILVAFISIMVFLMQINHCVFNAPRFIFGTFSSAIFLGSLGFIAHSVSNNIVAGYMLPMVFYILNMFQGSKLKMLYLFSLSKNSMNEKYWLFGGAILLFAVGILYKHIVRKVR